MISFFPWQTRNLPLSYEIKRDAPLIMSGFNGVRGTYVTL